MSAGSRTDPSVGRALCGAVALVALVLAGFVGFVGEPAATGAPETGSPDDARTIPAAEGGRVVTVNAASGSRLETMNPDGSGVRRFTEVAGFVVQPRWTPDAAGIVFSTDADGPFRLTFVKADGTGLRTILEDRPGFQAFTPAVTADGERVVFSRCPEDGTCSLYSVGLDGTGLTRLTNPGDGDGDFWPDVSPSGDQITFSRFHVPGITAQTWVADIDGGGAHPITAPALEAGRPRWMPGGQRILVTAQWVRVGENVASVRADGSGLRRLTSITWPHNASTASPSPSGRSILYVQDKAYPDLIGNDFFVMRADGTGKRLVRKGRFFETDWAASAPESGSLVGGADTGAARGEPLPTPATLTRYAAALHLDATLAEGGRFRTGSGAGVTP